MAIVGGPLVHGPNFAQGDSSVKVGCHKNGNYFEAGCGKVELRVGMLRRRGRLRFALSAALLSMTN